MEVIDGDGGGGLRWRERDKGGDGERERRFHFEGGNFDSTIDGIMIDYYDDD
jgi:hypothetical protein